MNQPGVAENSKKTADEGTKIDDKLLFEYLGLHKLTPDAIKQLSELNTNGNEQLRGLFNRLLNIQSEQTPKTSVDPKKRAKVVPVIDIITLDDDSPPPPKKVNCIGDRRDERRCDYPSTSSSTRSEMRKTATSRVPPQTRTSSFPSPSYSPSSPNYDSPSPQEGRSKENGRDPPESSSAFRHDGPEWAGSSPTYDRDYGRHRSPTYRDRSPTYGGGSPTYGRGSPAYGDGSPSYGREGGEQDDNREPHHFSDAILAPREEDGVEKEEDDDDIIWPDEFTLPVPRRVVRVEFDPDDPEMNYESSQQGHRLEEQERPGNEKGKEKEEEEDPDERRRKEMLELKRKKKELLEQQLLQKAGKRRQGATDTLLNSASPFCLQAQPSHLPFPPDQMQSGTSSAIPPHPPAQDYWPGVGREQMMMNHEASAVPMHHDPQRPMDQPHSNGYPFIPPLHPHPHPQMPPQMQPQMHQMYPQQGNPPLAHPPQFGNQRRRPLPQYDRGLVCPLCSFPHIPENCNEYPSAVERENRQRQLKLCALCLGQHPQTHCKLPKYTRKCKVEGCETGHLTHVALCRQRYPEMREEDRWNRALNSLWS